MDPLNRPLAPFGDEIWTVIDQAAAQVAADLLTARRFLEVEGPYGLGFTSIEAGGDDVSDRSDPTEAVAVLGAALSVPMLWKGFGLSLRRLAAHQQHGQPLDLTAVTEAAEAVARLEERLIYHGDQRTGLAGLLTAPGAAAVKGGDWTRLDQALADVLAAITTLAEGGYAGPYALVAEPKLYTGLYRPYADSELLQIDHIARLCRRGIFKAAITGALIIDPRAARLVVGQDLMAGFASLDGVHCRLFLSESLVLAIDDAGALCRIGGA